MNIYRPIPDGLLISLSAVVVLLLLHGSALSVCLLWLYCLHGSVVCLPVCVVVHLLGLLSLSAVVVLMHDGSAVCLWLYSCILI